MTGTRMLDAQWRSANPLPAPAGKDKNERGRVLIVGGSRFVPGALALTFEAAMRVGAGKVQLATIEAAAISLGVRLPEAAVMGLPAGDDGELTPDALPMLQPLLERTDCLVVGCGMIANAGTPRLLRGLIDTLPSQACAVVDAGAITALKELDGIAPQVAARLVLTPNHGESATLLDTDKEAVDADPEHALDEIVNRFGATTVIKDRSTFIGSSGTGRVRFVNEGTGLGTAGSGDVLAGVIGGLLSQGVPPALAAGWSVWLHAKAGQAVARKLAPTGFLAREVVIELPALLAEAHRSQAA